MKMSDNHELTVPGITTSTFSDPGIRIFDQNPTILGWTNGNMVGRTSDVSKWWYDLEDLDSTTPIVSNASRAEMNRVVALDTGMLKGIPYGAGVMKLPFSFQYFPDDYDSWGYYLGHAGETYGFSSLNGYMLGARAGFSVAANADDSQSTMYPACLAVQIVQEVVGGKKVDYKCSKSDPGARAGISKFLSAAVNRNDDKELFV